MIRSRLFAAVGVMAFGVGLAFAPVANAKNCPQLCKATITQCQSACLAKATDPNGKTIKKKKCRALCKMNIAKACRKSTNKTACSPSGAFVD